jgi:hypothetical protein
MTTPQQIAEAFSGHRFSDAYDHLAADIEWVLIGDATIQGRDQVIQACEQTAAELTETTTEFLRFLTIAGTGAVAVDTVARYEGADGTTSVVSSCDIYEFDKGVVAAAITSYSAELDPTEHPTPRHPDPRLHR